MSETIVDRLAQAVARSGKSESAISREATGNPDAIRMLRKKRTRNPRADTVHKLARVLNVSASWLLTGEHAEDGAEKPVTGRERPQPGDNPDDTVTVAEVAPFDQNGAKRDVPVYGTAAGSFLRADDGTQVAAFQMDDNPINYASRPPALVRVPNSYALYVIGESMLPLHPPGQAVFVDPNKPVLRGDSCILHIQVAPHREIEHMIATFLRRNDEYVIVQKLNPEATLHLRVETVVRLHKVLTINELFGL